MEWEIHSQDVDYYIVLSRRSHWPEVVLNSLADNDSLSTCSLLLHKVLIYLVKCNQLITVLHTRLLQCGLHTCTPLTAPVWAACMHTSDCSSVGCIHAHL